MPNYNTHTKTKFILSDRKGAPLLTPTWGSLNTLLKTVLVEGFNTQVISSIIVDPVTKIAIAKLSLGHGYIRNDVLLISGASQPEFNKEFRVVDFKADEITFVMPPETLITEATTATSITCKIAPLGYSLAYENTSEGAMCFKNTSIQSPAILKVIDKVPPNGYTTTWAKFARVVAGQEIDTSGDFIGNRKTPYNQDFPDMEKTGNRVSGAAGIHGLAKWDYGFLSTTNGYHYEYTVVDWAEATDWKIIGDSQTFYLMIKNEGKTSPYCIYGFGNFVSEDTRDTTNVVLQARHGNYAASTSAPYYHRTRTANQFLLQNGHYFGNYILSSIYGNIPYRSRSSLPESCYCCTGLNLNNDTRPWNSAGITAIHPITGRLITSEVGIKDADDNLRGRHRGIRIVYGVAGLIEGLETTNFDMVTLILNLALANSTSSSTMPVIFSLKDWEEVP